MRNPPRSGLLGGAAVLVAIASLGIVTSRDDDSARATTDGSAATATQPASTTRRRSWRVEANRVCKLRRKLYPSLALGAEADPDTVDYAVGGLVADIAAIPTSPPRAARERLERDARAAVAAWRSVATRPTGTVALVERRHAARTAARYVDELVSLGAIACRALRPHSV